MEKEYWITLNTFKESNAKLWTNTKSKLTAPRINPSSQNEPDSSVDNEVINLVTLSFANNEIYTYSTKSAGNIK